MDKRSGVIDSKTENVKFKNRDEMCSNAVINHSTRWEMHL